MNSMFRFKSLVGRSNSFKVKLNFNNFSDAFKNKEMVEEKIFIDKQERELMKKLLSKLEASGAIEKPKKEDHEVDALQHVLERHHKTISKELFNDLLKWKKGEI